MPDVSEVALAPLSSIATIGQHAGETVRVRGWLYNLRASGKLLFPICAGWERDDPGDCAEGGGAGAGCSRR